MSAALLVASWLTPLLLLPLALRYPGRGWSVLAALPALYASIAAGATLDISWLLLGVNLQMDQTARQFMQFSAFLWLAAAIYAELTAGDRRQPGGLLLFFLLSMAGNMLLIVSADMMTFYCGFALMGLAAYGMIVQQGSQRSRHAGRVYLAWTLAGELALFSAIVLIHVDAGSQRFAGLATHDYSVAAAGLLIIGFGIKLALPGLHFWLPITYAAAPAAAAAVLSGPMITAGLLGWLRFLPAGANGLGVWALPLQVTGVTGIVLGTLLGLLQTNPRALLGCSSILKMGVITAVFGTALAHPGSAPALLAALSLYALHHLLVKGTLFLGIGEWERTGTGWWLLAGLALLALALAGAPLTGGAAAKLELKAAAAGLAVPAAPLLFLSATATTLLLGRFFWLIGRGRRPGSSARVRPASVAWLMLVPLAIWLPFSPLGAAPGLSGLMPIVIGLGLLAATRSLQRRQPRAWRGFSGFRLLRHVITHGSSRVPRRQGGRFSAPWLPFNWQARLNAHGSVSLATGGLLWLAILVLMLLLVASG